MPPQTRQGRVSEGWSKQGIVVPDPVWTALRVLGEKHGYGSLKLLCSAGMGLIAGMPEDVRTGLIKWVAQAEVDGPSSITPEAVWGELERLLKARSTGNIQPIGRVRPMPVVPVNGPSGEEITHEVTRILDPELLKRKKGRGAA